MYKQRLHLCILLTLTTVAVCLARLVFLQTVCRQGNLDGMKRVEVFTPIVLPTVRGSIQDRNEVVLAYDSPAFYLHVNYRLTRLLDDRVWEAMIQQALQPGQSRDEIELALQQDYSDDLLLLERILQLASTLRQCDPDEIRQTMRSINETIWRLRRHLAWRKKFPSVPNIPDSEKDKALSLADILRIDIVEMHKSYPIIELTDEGQRYAAQVETAGIVDVEILPEAKRMYPFGSSACQIIGWVGPAQPEENALFPEDEFARYLPNEVSGKDGIERVCEIILRGRRGEVTYDKDGDIIDKIITQLGQDIRLTLDIVLQKRIEKLLADPNQNPNSDAGLGVVVLDVASGDILAMVSLPLFDLNIAREQYARFLKDPTKPMLNRCLAEHYPPGSSIKPIILLAGLEERKIGASEIISCPAVPAEKGWPNCLLFREFHSCHDWKWDNFGRNAIRGSCNVYFSRLAHRFDVTGLQKWLWDFGFGHRILTGPQWILSDSQLSRGMDRSIAESPGQISMQPVISRNAGFQDIPPMPSSEKKWFGIGQGNLRVTVLQVANAYAALARGGIYKNPRLFVTDDDPGDQTEIPLPISPASMSVVRDGMQAVIYEDGGTANKVFSGSDFAQRSMKIYGKTGSTQRPAHAWFACFATDSAGRAISVAILVEAGASGARDACPIGKKILELCNDLGYIGSPAR